jgi:hypothetical protein
MDYRPGESPPMPCDSRHVLTLQVDVEALPDRRAKVTRHVSFIGRDGNRDDDLQTWIEAPE